MRFVIDTNVLLVSVSSKSRLHWIWEYILTEHIELVISNDILTEYEEVFTKHNGKVFSQYLLETIESLNSKIETEVYFNWNLISADVDDNKFVDAAIAGKADYIVTHDKHFDILKSIDFPKVNVIDTVELKSFLHK